MTKRKSNNSRIGLASANNVKTLTIITPCYNEEEVLPDFIKEIGKVIPQLNDLGFLTKIIFVDDGSTDKTVVILDDICQKDDRFSVIHFSRNFGHQAALEAGYKLAQKDADAIVTIDADLQDPPELIIDMAKEFKDGADIVLAKREERAGETGFKLITAKYFYKILDSLTSVQMYQNVGDFRLVSKRVLSKMLKFKEQRKYWRGIVSFVGFKPVFIKYDRNPRLKGKTHYTLSKMLRLADTALTNFSELSTKVANLSLIFAIMFIFGSVTCLIFNVGYLFLSIMMYLMFFILMVLVSLILKYMYIIFLRVVNRPNFIVDYVIVGRQRYDKGEIINQIED